MVTHRRGIGPFEVCTDSKVWGREALTIRGLFAEYQSDWNGHDMQALGNLFTAERSVDQRRWNALEREA